MRSHKHTAFAVMTGLGILMGLAGGGAAQAGTTVAAELDTATSGSGGTSELETTSPYQYAFDMVPTLSATDLAQSAIFTQVLGAKHPVSASISVLQDGRGASSNNSTSENYFSDYGQAPNGARFLIDLGASYPIAQFNSYSYHSGTRTPQVYALYGSNLLGSPGTIGAPGLAGYTQIASVNTTSGTGADGTPLGFLSGQEGVSVFDSVGDSIGTYRYLLVDANTNVGGDGGTLFSEMDVVKFIPEPATLSLLALGGLALVRRQGAGLRR